MQKLYGNFEEIWLEGGICHAGQIRGYVGMQTPAGMQSSPAGLFAPPVF